MSFAFDPEIGAAMEALAQTFGGTLPTQPPRGDALGLRAFSDPLAAEFMAHEPKFPEVERRTVPIKSADGTMISGRWFTKSGSAPGSASLFIHGGGTVCGTVELFDSTTAAYVAATGVPMLSVEYRLTPENPHPKPAEDCYAAFVWLSDHASEFGIDPNRIATMGESAGGLLSAAVALMARDRGRKLARQILIYPMLDDRTQTPDPEMVAFSTWTYDNNYTAWRALLAAEPGTRDVHPYAAPAYAKDLRGLAPAYIEVGELDIFRDEDIEYARRLSAAAVSVELHVHPGAPHSFEHIAPDSAVAKRAMADRHRVLRAL